MDDYIGEVRLWAGSYVPKNWAYCEGQIIPINQNTALFSLIGTQFGGDGRVNFKLPDLRGRAAVCAGVGYGLSPRGAGEVGGQENVQLSMSNMGMHNHTVNCDTTTSGRSLKTTPLSNLFANKSNAGYGDNPNGVMKSNMLSMSGESTAHDNMPPWTALRFIICMYGLYPSRS